MKKIWTLLLSSLLIVLLLAGCAGSLNNTQDKGTSSWDGAPAISPETEAAVDYAGQGVGVGEVYDSLQGKTLEELYGGRKVILNYTITLQTNDFDGVLAAIEQRLAEQGGYAQSSSIEGKKPSVYGDAGRNARLVLRVPAERADAFVKGVETLGTLLSSYTNSDDITDAYFDTDSRLGVLKIELERLQAILVQTDNLADIITLESRISEVMLEIEQLTGTLKKYDALVAYTTVDLYLNEESLKEGPAGEKTAGDRISEGFMDSLYGVGTFFTNLFVWFVSALPVLILVAILAAFVILIVRACAKRSAKRRAKAAVLQQALFEQQKAAWLEQQMTDNQKTPTHGAKETEDENK